MVNFLDLAPKVHSETHILETADGPVTLELTGIALAALAEIAKRYPIFARIIEGGAGSIFEASEAWPAVIAAGLGHAGSSAHEDKIRQFAPPDIIAMAMTVMRVTFPTRTAEPDPLPAAVGDGLAVDMANSPNVLSN
jgi:hypothetical protein